MGREESTVGMGHLDAGQVLVDELNKETKEEA